MNFQLAQQVNTLKFNKCWLIIALLSLCLLCSCGSNKKKPETDDIKVLALALQDKNFLRVSLLLSKVRMTENTTNLIRLFLHMHSESLLRIEREVDYLKQFSSSMGLTHQSMLNEMMIWLYVKKIYRHEISPSIRIIQREELYLEPSHIDFSKCPSQQVGCAMEARNKVVTLLTNEQLSSLIKKMAIKDPCVNSSTRLQGEAIANRCLKKSKGQLKIELLSKPRFSTNQWLQVINTKS